MKSLSESILSSLNEAKSDVTFDIKHAGLGVDAKDRDKVPQDYFGNKLAEGDHIVCIINNKELQVCEVLSIEGARIELKNLKTNRKIPNLAYYLAPVCVKLPE